MLPEEEVVDLTDSPDEAPDHRASGKRRRPEGAPIDLAADAEEEDGVEEAAAARARIMQHALRVNQQRGISSGGTAPPPATQPQQHQPAGLAGGTDAAIEAPAPAAVGNSLLAQLHAERMARQSQRQQGQAQGPPSSNGHLEPQQQGQHQQQQHHRQAQGPPSGYDQPAPQQQGQGPGLPQGPAQLSLLSYNVWFQDVCIQRRMAAIGSIIQARQPDFVCLQEVTPLIAQLFRGSPWWQSYCSSPCPAGAPYFTMLLWKKSSVQGPSGYAELPFENSIMGRDLKTVGGTVCGWPVRVATTHLESPTGWDQLFSEQRVAQCRQASAVLDKAREGDVLFAGDMNWGPNDGPPPLPAGWSDAWLHLHSEDAGLTYDPRSNPMLKKGNRIRRRLDRVFVRLRHWRLHSMELVGREALPGLDYDGRPVLPSDHFGVLLVLRPAQ